MSAGPAVTAAVLLPEPLAGRLRANDCWWGKKPSVITQESVHGGRSNAGLQEF